MHCPRILPAMLMLLAVQPLQAQDSWETIGQDRNRQVQLDRSSIMGSDGAAKVAWARIVLPPLDVEAQGFASIKALNRFDCSGRSFKTIKRVYLDERNIVLREEDAENPASVFFARNTVDERLWREVCRPDAGGGGAPDAAAPSRPLQQDSRALAASAAALAMAAERAAGQTAGRPAAEPPASPRRSAQDMPAQPRPPASRITEGTTRPARRGADWSFEGSTGPEHWGRLRREWAQCDRGQQQSPIDLVRGEEIDLAPLVFEYPRVAFRVVDTGRLLQMHVGNGLAVNVRDQRYALTHLQLHYPLHERIDDLRPDAAIHLHHRAADGQHLILVVPLQLGFAENPVIRQLLAHLPPRGGETRSGGELLDLLATLPPHTDYYLYPGSLITPPCTEGVVWVVMRRAVSLSAEQLYLLQMVHPDTSRPTRAAHDRRVYRAR